MFKKLIFATLLAVGAVSSVQAQSGPFNWSGHYVGGTVGYGWNKSSHLDFPFNSAEFNIDGVVAGLTAGANWQRGSVVYGIEADFSFADINGVAPVIPLFSCGAAERCYTGLETLGTVRGRVGIAYDRLLPFVTAGFAYGKIRGEIGAFEAKGSSYETGWTVGAGIEYAFSHNWTVKLEYLYVDLGSSFRYDRLNVCGAPGCSAEYDAFNVVRFGVNYRW